MDIDGVPILRVTCEGREPLLWPCLQILDEVLALVHTCAEHTLNIDFLNPAMGPRARVAVELTEDSARALARAILRALPPG